MSKNTTTDQDLDFLISQLRSDLPRLQREYAVRSLGLFGSYLRGKQKKGSDLDILVDFEEVPGMFRFLDLERELSQLLNVRVDLVQKEALKPAIGKRILQEVLTV
jgi:predicted nucleotidyltransferase